MKKILSLLFVVVICLSLWACGGSSSTGSSGQSGASQSGYSDPNGFATKEALVDAYMTMYIRVISKEEFRKFHKEITWNSGWLAASFEETYASYKAEAEKGIAQDKQRFGNDYHLTWEIVSVEDTTNYGGYTEEDRQICLDVFGVEPEDHHMYEITVSVTGSGSKDEFTNPDELVLARKIGNKWYLY